MVRGYIYRHWIINDKGIEKSYIGKTIQKPSIRWGKDGSKYLKHDTRFSNAIKKYGWNNFSHDIVGIVECESKEQLIKDLNEWEKYYIDKYNSFHNGYNSTTGGDGGLTLNEEQRKKLSDLYKGKKLSNETKRKISESIKGAKNPNYGKTMSDEQKRKISESRKGITNYEIKIICITTGEIFDSIRQASEYYGVDNSSLVKCCKGKRKSCGKHPTTGEKLEWCYCSNES